MTEVFNVDFGEVTVIEKDDGSFDEGYNKGKTDGFVEGKTAEQTAFWDIYQDNGNRRNYDYAFVGSGWTDEVYNPKYSIVTELCNYMFRQSKVTNTKVPIILVGEYGAELFVDSDVEEIKSIEATDDNFDWSIVFLGAKNLVRVGVRGVISCDFYIDESENLDDETLIAFVHALTPDGGFVVYFNSNIIEKLSTIYMDERSPEYEGQSLENVIFEKGWTF